MALRAGLSLLLVIVAASGCGGDDSQGGADGGPGVDGGGGGDGDAGVPPDAAPAPEIPGGDPSFGTGGLVIIENPATEIGALWSPLVMPDGRIVAVGRSFESIVVVRMLPDGTPDPTFGLGGVVMLGLGAPVNGFLFRTGGLAIDDEGRLIISGYINLLGGGTRPIALRLQPSGALDESFGDAGMVVLDMVGATSTADAVALQPDGKIVLAGTDGVMRLYRLLPDGALDDSFGDGGKARNDFGLGGPVSRAWDVEVLSGGEILASGTASSRVALARFTSSGALDTSFGGGDGHVLDDAAGDGLTNAYDMAVGPDGSIAVAGRRPQTFAVGRFTAAGALDDTFGVGGWVNDEDGNQLAFDVERLPDGKLLVSGLGRWNGTFHTLARLLPNGSLDTTFGEGGLASSQAQLGIALQGDKIVTVGAGAIARHLADGTPDTSFGQSGVARPPFSPAVDRALALALMPDGSIVLGGAAGIIGPGALVRLAPDGSIDPTYGQGGRIPAVRGLFLVTALVAEPDGNLLVGGLGRPGLTDPQVTRLDPSGAVLTEFLLQGLPEGGPSSETSAVVQAMARAADGSVLIMGDDRTETNELRYWVARFRPDGQLDTSFGDGGAATAPGGFNVLSGAIAEQPDGKLVIAASGKLIRFTADGSLDGTFGEGGVVELATPNTRPLALAVDGDGGILLVTAGWTSGTLPLGLSITLSRYDGSGQLDPSFGDGGQVIEELGPVDYVQAPVNTPVGLALDGDGGIYLAAAVGSDGLREVAALWRYTASGAPDTSFGDGGRLLVPMSSASSALYALALDGAGRLVAAGRAFTPTGGSEYAVARIIPQRAP